MKLGKTLLKNISVTRSSYKFIDGVALQYPAILSIRHDIYITISRLTLPKKYSD
jgi:hypothetical protein